MKSCLIGQSKPTASAELQTQAKKAVKRLRRKGWKQADFAAALKRMLEC